MNLQPRTSSRLWIRLLFLALGYIAFILLGSPEGLRGVAWTPIQAEFKVTPDFLGVLLFPPTVGYLLSSFFSGRVTGLLGTGRALACAAALMGMGLVGYGVAPTWLAIVSIGFAIGFGGGIIDAGLNTFLAAHYHPSLLYLLHAFFGVGTTLSPLFITDILRRGESWRLAYQLVGGAAFVLAVIFLLTSPLWNRFERQPAKTKADASAVPVARTALFATLRLPMTWLGIVLFFIYAGVEGTVGAWAFSVFTAQGVSEVNAGAWLSTYWGTFTLGRVLSIGVAQVLSTTTLLRGAMISVIGGALLFVWSPSPEVGLAGVVLIGLFTAPVFPALIANTGDRVGNSHAPNAIGFQVAAAGLGLAVMPGLAGWLAVNTPGKFTSISLSVLVVALLIYALYEWTLLLARRKGNAGEGVEDATSTSRST